MVECTTIGQAAPEIEGADEEPVELTMVPAMNDDMEVDNDIDDNNLEADNYDADDGNLDADHNNDALLHFRSINNILRTAGFVPQALVAVELHVVSSDEPISFAKPSAIQARGSLINLPLGCKRLG
jgi:hypothetical protein